ncbi:MAG: agmatinase family protein [Bacteroidetes bacterium]|nr:agmatinase family protein [Bacteroidota bacterium]
MISKQQKINSYDPNGLGQVDSGMYGLPFDEAECEIVIVPVPWEVTVSYGGGTAEGPGAVFEASYQVDLYDPVVKDAWKYGIHFDETNTEIREKSVQLREKAEACIALLAGEDTYLTQSDADIFMMEIYENCLWLNDWVKNRCLHFLRQNKTLGLLGGDHSTPLGMMQALAEHVGKFGILQIDAHADLRDAYEGFHFSHASIMYNALKIEQVEKLVQVGIRDYCQEELDVITGSNGRVKTFFDRDLKHAAYSGETWAESCDRIIAELPQHIYLSFDIDGLDPKLCPNTGTPVAGGFEAEQILFLIEKIVKSGKKIVAFDINEIAPDKNGDNDWDANVGARLLYRIANMVAMSQGKTV